MKQIYIFTLLFTQFISAQLSVGDIAFIGYNTDSGPGTNDNFTFIALTNIPGNEIIYFTEEGWNNTTNTWSETSEGHIQYTTPTNGLSCGTIININESSSNTFTVTGGGTATFSTGSSWSLSGGDQVLAYQAMTAEPLTPPTFIAGVHGDDGNGTPLTLDPITLWNSANSIPLGTTRSELPLGLTNAINCVSLFPVVGTELDNARYNGTLTGTSTALRLLINDYNNWGKDNSTAFDISPNSYTPNVDCTTLSIDNFNLENKFKIYPNPTTYFITVFGLNKIEKYKIINALGSVMLNGDISNEEKINVENLSKGLYFLKFENGHVFKFIKE